MPTETTVRAQQLQPGSPDEADYRAFCSALSESARGRAFLAEYARRNRNADTRPLLTAIERLQVSLAADPATPAEALVKQKLRVLLDDITTAQNEIEASVMAIRTAKLADLIAMVEQRLVEIMASATSSPVPRSAPRTVAAAAGGRAHRRGAHPSCRRAAARSARTADPLARISPAAADRAGSCGNNDGGSYLCRASVCDSGE